MLSQFTFSNFKCFKDEITLDLTPSNINEHKETLITDAENEKYLPLAALYGPNGGGKSTVLNSLRTLRSIILGPIITLNREINETNNIKFLTTADFSDNYHRFEDNCKELPICFDLLFSYKEYEYKYEIKFVNGAITEENLYMRKFGNSDAEILFERNLNDIYLGKFAGNISVSKLKNTLPLLTHLSFSYDFNEINRVINWLLEVVYFDYDDPILDTNVLIPTKIEQRKLLFNMFKETDINISDIRVEKDANGKISRVFCVHSLSNGGSVEIPFEDESSGTRKLFTLLQRIITALKKGSLVIADEMDAKLHPKLLKYIINLFTDNKINKNGAQLIFTSHDLTTMTSEVFRRDEIWFCALNADNASHLYSLVEFKKRNGEKVRADESYGKRYLQGHYGADPYLRKMLNWEEFINE